MESWVEKALQALATAKAHGYRPDAPTASEPAAWTAMALLLHERIDAATPLLNWLAEHQGANGSVGINVTDAEPGWPTSLAILAWQTAATVTKQSELYASQTAAAVQWLLRVSGVPVERSRVMGHDSTLIGWPWVSGTHSWIEPTALAVLALKATGHADHPRTREAVTLLIDRLLPTGGCNYGNTTVLGQMLRPHLQPTGITLLALTGEEDPAGRILASQDFLARNLTVQTPAASLAYGILGLAAYDRVPTLAGQWLEAAYRHTVQRGADSLRLALLILAAAGARAPVIRLVPTESAHR